MVSLISLPISAYFLRQIGPIPACHIPTLTSVGPAHAISCANCILLHSHQRFLNPVAQCVDLWWFFRLSLWLMSADQ